YSTTTAMKLMAKTKPWCRMMLLQNIQLTTLASITSVMMSWATLLLISGISSGRMDNYCSLWIAATADRPHVGRKHVADRRLSHHPIGHRKQQTRPKEAGSSSVRR